MLSVGYVARRGLHQQREADINQPTLATLAPYRDANGNLPSGLPGLLDSLRPYQGYNSIRETDNVASSMYNSLQISWNKRFTHGFAFGVAYTLSKSMDDGSAQRNIIPNTYDASNLWGYSDFDARHVFIANYIYELPFFKNQNNLAGKAPRRMADQRHHPVPDRHAVQRRRQHRLRRRRPGRQHLRHRPVLEHERHTVDRGRFRRQRSQRPELLVHHHQFGWLADLYALRPRVRS